MLSSHAHMSLHSFCSLGGCAAARETCATRNVTHQFWKNAVWNHLLITTLCNHGINKEEIKNEPTLSAGEMKLSTKVCFVLYSAWTTNLWSDRDHGLCSSTAGSYLRRLGLRWAAGSGTGLWVSGDEILRACRLETGLWVNIRADRIRWTVSHLMSLESPKLKKCARYVHCLRRLLMF